MIFMLCVCLAGDVPYHFVDQWAENTKVKHRGAAYEAFKRDIKERLVHVLLEEFPHLEGDNLCPSVRKTCF